MYTLIAGMLLLVGCVTSEDDSKSDLSKQEEKKLAEYHAEIEVGRNMAGRLLQYYGTYDDPSLLKYLNKVTAYLGRFSSEPERKYMVAVLDSEIINAFACPGGYILVTLGSLRHARDEAQIAGVLAHEIAHVDKKHMFEKIRGMSKKELEEADRKSKAIKNMPKTVQARMRQKPEENKVAAIVAKYLAGGASGLNIVKAAGAGMNVMLDQGLGAEKEFEADSFGVGYLMNSGYDPNGLSNFVCRIGGAGKFKKGRCALKGKPKKKKNSGTILDRTHPSVADRIASINEKLIELEADKIIGAKGKKRYLKIRRKLKKKS